MYVASKTEIINFDHPGYSSAYFNDAFDQDKVIAKAEKIFKTLNIEFDSFVALGLSGLTVAPLLAYHFKVPFLALRKPNVKCHDHGIGRLGRGSIGKRWVFVDDFVSSGATIRMAMDHVSRGLEEIGYPNHTEYVGTFAYNRNGRFHFPDWSSRGVETITLDGKDMHIDSEDYEKARILYSDAKYYGYADPKGHTLLSLKNDSSVKSDLKTLSAIVIAVAKAYDKL